MFSFVNEQAFWSSRRIPGAMAASDADRVWFSSAPHRATACLPPVRTGEIAVDLFHDALRRRHVGAARSVHRQVGEHGDAHDEHHAGDDQRGAARYHGERADPSGGSALFCGVSVTVSAWCQQLLGVGGDAWANRLVLAGSRL